MREIFLPTKELMPFYDVFWFAVLVTFLFVCLLVGWLAGWLVIWLG